MLIHSKHIFAILTFKHIPIHPQWATRSPIYSAKIKSFIIKLQWLWPPPSERIGRLTNRFIITGVKINHHSGLYVIAECFWKVVNINISVHWFVLNADWSHHFPLSYRMYNKSWKDISILIHHASKDLLFFWVRLKSSWIPDYMERWEKLTWIKQLPVLACRRTCLHTYRKWQPLWVHTPYGPSFECYSFFSLNALILNRWLNNCYILI